MVVQSGCASTPPPQYFSSFPATPSDPVSVVGRTSPAGASGEIFHVVGPSETLWRISKTYSVDIDTIMRANNLSDPSKLENGQTLRIPGSKGPKPVIPLYPSNKWSYIVVHHTATHDGDAYTIDQLHHKRGFWNGLGYHFLINNGTNGKADGQIQVGPRWIKQQDGAHANAAGMNEMGIGIVVVGNFSERYLTSSEFESVVFLIKTLQNYYGIPERNVIRHRDVPGKNTECPGIHFPWLKVKQALR